MATNERTEAQVILDTEALKLKTAGWSYRRIGAHFGVSQTTAFNRCKRALAMIPAEAVDEYRRIEGERLDLLLEVAMEKALSGDKGAMFGVDRALAIMDRRARMMGLDAPTKHEVITLDYIQSEILRLEASLDDNSPAETGEPAEA